MDSTRLPRLAIWTRITCDALLIVGGTLLAIGALYLAPNKWFIGYGVLAAVVAVITACSRRQRTRKQAAFLLFAILFYVAAIMLFATTRGGFDQSVLVAVGYLAAWPTLGLLWLFLDRQARYRIDRFTSVDCAESADRLIWWEPIARLAYGFVILLYTPFCIFYSALWIPSLLIQVESQSWSQAQGTIVLSEVREESDSAFLGEYNLLYNYRVDGKPYRGTRHNGLHPALVGRGCAMWLAEQYIVDSRATVHYQANDPSQSLLQPGVTPQIMLLLLGMALTLGLPIPLSYLAFDRELRFLLPKDRYERYGPTVATTFCLSLGFSGFVAALTAAGFMALTDYNPTHIDALSAWIVALGAGWLIFRWIYRQVVCEWKEKQAVKERLISETTWW